ncbi:MAG: alpha/beta fold hydrolase, partial [Parvularculaceae bacterium]
MPPRPLKLTFPGASGADLSACLDLPAGPIKAWALFAHCFTCTKDLLASRKLAQALTNAGFAVMRFDFTGLGNSGGDFASTNFSSNLEDLHSAIGYMRDQYQAPSLLIGHSLGGAAVLAIAGGVPEVQAVAAIAAPAEAAHLIDKFDHKLDEIERLGEAEVMLSERPFKIKQQLIDDLSAQNVLDRVATLKKPLLILHAPFDNVVGIENAKQIFKAAKHPKSFVSLDGADHLLSKPEDAAYAASVIAGWASRYVKTDLAIEPLPHGEVLVEETGIGNYQNHVRLGGHTGFADEPTAMGGQDTGPAPYEYVAAGLGACTSITLRMYADRKKWPVDQIKV